MQQRRQPHARSFTVGNCSLTVAALKESLTVQQVPAATASRPFGLGRGGGPRMGAGDNFAGARAPHQSDLCPGGNSLRQSTVTNH
jgi:hypothetical protein